MADPIRCGDGGPFAAYDGGDPVRRMAAPMAAGYAFIAAVSARSDTGLAALRRAPNR